MIKKRKVFLLLVGNLPLARATGNVPPILSFALGVSGLAPPTINEMPTFVS